MALQSKPDAALTAYAWQYRSTRKPRVQQRTRSGACPTYVTDLHKATRRMSRRTVIFGFADQGIASLTSLLILATAAQSLEPRDLGFFAIGVASVIPSVSIIRSMTGETLLVRAASLFGNATNDNGLRKESHNVIGLAIGLGCAASLVIAVIGLLWVEPRQVLLCSAISVIPVVVQDCLRHVCITLRYSGALLAGDILMLSASVVTIGTVGHLDMGPGPMILAWGLAGLAASGLAMAIGRMAPSARGSLQWLKEAWPSSSAFVVEATAGAIIGYAIVVVLGILASPTEVAGYRATVSVFGITSLVINFLRTAVLRELNPERLGDQKTIWQLFSWMASLVICTSLGTLLVIVFMPDSWGKLAFGETWPLITQLAVWATVNRIGAGLSIIPLIFLRAQGVAWRATKIRLMLSAPLAILAPVASGLAGAPGAFMADTLYYLAITIFLMMMSINRSGSFVKNS